MAWQSSGASNAELVENMWRNGLITDPRVKAALLRVDRAHYAPHNPYEDAPQLIGHGVTISAPHMHATAAEYLAPFIRPDDDAHDNAHDNAHSAPRVLDIGAGSGYLTHVLAALAGDQGAVVGVEHIPALSAQAATNLAKSADGRRMLDAGRVRFVVADGRLGAPPALAEPPFDAIHVGAAAAELHPALLAQLKAPGRIFIPMDDPDDPRRGQAVWTIDKAADGSVTRTRLFGVRYVPLTDAPTG